ncbi:hypothetical protein HMPREF1112_0294 [Streptococcus pseudopneumoniae SK674]|nr:hypothetical protein HMPREF1112_0294 [Streptococcus pseudopneumoniae SK674]ETD99505.1 hypothetical protein U753_09380 [Streptococcus pseudopneumoniae 5247]PLV78886.1 hypothetical protein AZJ07_08420 [Streptococcus pseudopneumoniae]
MSFVNVILALSNFLSSFLNLPDLIRISYTLNKFILFENLFKPPQLPSEASKQCFEQPTASFLVCSLIFIEY